MKELRDKNKYGMLHSTRAFWKEKCPMRLTNEKENDYVIAFNVAVMKKRK